ncbi:(2Fe-2S)-binding protein [Pseudonocardia sp. C8]|uniref:(2Fe-2S)-binding protein n=1 Tax=Pseudonocardia sp. C8 TaxID=2762759 RepID=UPI001C92E426|nr:(2Fe-2S)-binding protein [Pseudonocardia sp. C8]
MPVGRELADVARIGPWFAVGVLPPGRPPAGWRRWDELYTPPGAGADPLSARIAQVAASLGTGRRVAASIAVQGMAARLVSMPFAAVALHGVLPRLGELHRDPAADDPWAPALPAADEVSTAGSSHAGAATFRSAAGSADPGPAVGVPAGVRTPDPRQDPDGAADLLARELAGTHLEPLYAAVTARVSVSERVLRGNVVSAIAGAARVMEAMRRADRPAFLALLGALAGHPALRGPLPEGATGRLLRLDDADPDTEWSFRRRSCCLYVRVPGGGTCGDCVLTTRR